MVFAFRLRRRTELEDIQHLEMLVVFVHTMFRGCLRWKNLFETVLRTFDVVPKGFERFFACDEVMFVHEFIIRR